MPQGPFSFLSSRIEVCGFPSQRPRIDGKWLELAMAHGGEKGPPMVPPDGGHILQAPGLRCGGSEVALLDLQTQRGRWEGPMSSLGFMGSQQGAARRKSPS